MGRETDSLITKALRPKIFFAYEHSDNFGVYRQTDTIELIGLVFRGSDNHIHFYDYGTDGGRAPNSYRTEEMEQIIGLMGAMEKGVIG